MKDARMKGMCIPPPWLQTATESGQLVAEDATCSGDATSWGICLKKRIERMEPAQESWRSRAIQTLWYETWRLQDLVLALMGLVWLWSSLSHVLIPPFWNDYGYSILWGPDEVLSKCVLLKQAWLCRGLQWLIPMAMVNLHRQGSELWQSLPLGLSVKTDSVYRKCPP